MISRHPYLVGVVSACGRWVWSLGGACDQSTSLPSGCGQCVWLLGGACDQSTSLPSGCGQCVWLLGGACDQSTSLPCFHTLFQLHHDRSSPLHRILFFPRMVLFVIVYITVYYFVS